MRLSRIEFDGYRNLSDAIEFSHPISVLVGANNSGKSNIIDALRMTLMPYNGWPLKVRRDDFNHGGTGDPVVGSLTITARFENLNVEQSGRMITALDGSADRAAMHFHAELPNLGQPRGRYLGGKAMSPDLEEWARSSVTYTYLPPLRDAEEDLRPGRSNRLIELIAALTGDSSDRELILEIAKKANSDLSEVASLKKSRSRIQERLTSMSGAGRAQNAELLFTEPLFERVLATLGVRVGDDLPLAMSQNGLGMNNILYMAVLLAGLTYESDSSLHLLLVEEPEAHLHPQMQDLLMRFLEKEVSNRNDVQVIVTTHSPNITASAQVERITSLSKVSGRVNAKSIAQMGLQDEELQHLARFLDATKASLLFSRAVILVEGISEQLVIPLLASELDPPINLLENSVSVINIGGLAFGPFAALYDDGRLLNRCAIISDADPPKAADNVSIEESGSDVEVTRDVAIPHGDDSLDAPLDTKSSVAADQPDPVLSSTAQKLLSTQNERRHVFLSARTFEYDLVMAGNWEWCVSALKLIKPRVGKWLDENQDLDTIEKKAAALLGAVDGVKGRFAQALTNTLALTKESGHVVRVPTYIRDAIAFVCGADEASPSG